MGDRTHRRADPILGGNGPRFRTRIQRYSLPGPCGLAGGMIMVGSSLGAGCLGNTVVGGADEPPGVAVPVAYRTGGSAGSTGSAGGAAWVAGGGAASVAGE